MFHTNAIANATDIAAATVLAQFDDLTGSVLLRAEELEVLNRPGVDGSGVRKLGRRGRTFQLQSVVYAPSFEWAKTAIEFYNTLPGMDPLYLIKQSVQYGSFLVLRVTPDDPQAVYNVAGNAVAYSYGYTSLECRLTATWELLG